MTNESFGSGSADQSYDLSDKTVSGMVVPTEFSDPQVNFRSAFDRSFPPSLFDVDHVRAPELVVDSSQINVDPHDADEAIEFVSPRTFSEVEAQGKFETYRSSVEAIVQRDYGKVFFETEILPLFSVSLSAPTLQEFQFNVIEFILERLGRDILFKFCRDRELSINDGEIEMVAAEGVKAFIKTLGRKQM